MKEIRIERSFSILVLGLTALVSSRCATLRSTSPGAVVVAPVALQPLFAACTPTDGSVQLSLIGGGRNIPGIEMVWSMPSDSEWDIQFNSVIGETQLEIQRRRSVFIVPGGQDISIERESSGALVVNDLRIPVLDTELPCILNGKWPVGWLNLTSTSRSSSGAKSIHRMVGGDNLRTFEIESTVSDGAHVIDSCTVIKWGGFLHLFRHSSRVCLKRWTGGYSVNMVGPSDYNIKWVTDHESR